MHVLPSVVLGLLPSLANSIVAACVGYYTVTFQSPRFFFRALVAMNAAPIVALWGGLDDRLAKCGPGAVWLARVYAPFLGLLAALALLACALHSEVAVLGGVALLGLCSGLMSTGGAVLVSAVDRGNLTVVWASSALGGALGVVVCAYVGFDAYSSARQYEDVYAYAAFVSALAMAPMAFSHACGGLHEAFLLAWEAQPIVPLPKQRTDGSEYIQFCNTVLTVFPLPLLPFLVPPLGAQQLIVTKLLADFGAALFLLCVGADTALGLRWTMLATRIPLFAGVVASAVGWVPGLLWWWGCFAALGFLLTGLNDLAGGSGSRPLRIKANRTALFSGVIIGVSLARLLLAVNLPDAWRPLIEAARRSPLPHLPSMLMLYNSR